MSVFPQRYALIVCCLLAGNAWSQPAPLVKLDAATVAAAEKHGGNASVSTFEGTSWLRLETTAAGEASVTFVPASGKWDLSEHSAVSMRVRNAGPHAVTVRARLDNSTAERLMDSCRGAAVLVPGQQAKLVVRIVRRPEDPGYAVFQPFYMYFKQLNVRDNTLDPAQVARMIISIDEAAVGSAVEFSDIIPEGAGSKSSPPFLPFVDKYGQYVHADWPGKIYEDADFARNFAEEIEERKDWPGASDWDRYGGWKSGPVLNTTGFFSVAKHDGKWWLVDPEGRLFWSFGPTGVGFGGDVSPITDRENWFVELPPKDDPKLGGFYHDGRGATYRYYQNRSWTGYDIQRANLLRKYGSDYETVVANLSHDRLRSWGYNTMANWSDPRIYGLRRTPYTVAVHYDSPLIHYRMPDVYHPAWEPALRASLAKQKDTTANDPWNIGYFVDNERWWGWRPRAAAIGEETLKNPPETPAKVKFVEQLRGKYPDIKALNEAWGTSHESWEALLAHKQPPDMKNATVLSDCGDFGMAFAEHYLKVVRAAVKEVAPNNMYLGCRFHGHIDPAVVRLVSQYADVVSYNIYDNPPDGRVNQYRSLDVPIMSTEWGVGSDPNQTPFRGDDLKVPTPRERAQSMASYAMRAIRHPNMVGAHFFQYRDQPLSGRPDGEATLRGFVNIADTPNFEMVRANRQVGYDLYKTRSQAK